MSSLARRSGRLVVLCLADVADIPRDLGGIRLVYAQGNAEDVLVVTEDGEQRLRLDYVNAIEEEAVRVASIYADHPTTDRDNDESE